MFRLDGKVALITGASGGIGASIATTLHAQGAIVALSGEGTGFISGEVIGVDGGEFITGS